MPYDATPTYPDKTIPFRMIPSSVLFPEKQRTLTQSIDCHGIGVHSGISVHMRIVPAPVNTGIVFVRTDLRNGARTIPARWDYVVETRLCSVLGNAAGSRVATVEHLMAALYASGIDNALIEIDGAEVPVMDGSSDPFITLIDAAGTCEQSLSRKVIRVLSPIEVTAGDKYVRLLPAPETRMSCSIHFDQLPTSAQSYEITLSPASFKHELARARTFGFYEEVEQLQKLGFARGGSLENAIVIKDNKVLNQDGLRYQDEFVRHKLLDAVGDLALAGGVILGHFEGHCPGHALNNQLLRALFADPSAYSLTTHSQSA